jgi:hypothetical protein
MVMKIGNAFPDESLIRGGPFYKAQEFTRLITPNRWNLRRRITFAVAIGWLPLLLITVLFNTNAIMSFLRDYRVHSRVLIAVPILLLGQTFLEIGFRNTVAHIRNTQLLDDEGLVNLDNIIKGLRRLRDSAIPELAILVLVIAHTTLSFGGMVDLTPWLAYDMGGGLELTPAGWYAVLVSASLFQLLLGLGLWKWLLWTVFTFKLSRLDLKLYPTHADCHGGLGFLGLSSLGFAPIAFAATAVIGATWRHEIILGRAHLVDFKFPAIALVVIVAGFALLPLAFFAPRLAELRRKGMLEYSKLGQVLSAEFHKRWILQREGEASDVLANVESSNLVDFSSDYDRIKQLVPLPVNRNTLIALAASVVIPAIPTILAQIPVAVVLKDLASALR